MTLDSQNIGRRSRILAALLALFIAGFIQPASAQSKEQLSKKELMALVASAKTAQDHEKLAAYYKTEALHLQAEAKDHAEMAEMYKKNPGWETGKNPYAYRTEAHCRYVSDRYRDAATRTQALAELHAEMAKKAPK